MLTSIIIVHGKKPLRGGSMHPAFIERLDQAVRLARQSSYQEILITGGPTRTRVVTEAKMGRQYLLGRTKLPVRLEDKSRTTAENIIFTQAEEIGRNNKELSNVAVITSRPSILRTRYLYKKLWPEVYKSATFVGAKQHNSLVDFLTEPFYYLYALLDPKEQYTGYLKRLFRNM